MSDQKPVSDLTHDELRREIAERLGYSMVYGPQVREYTDKDVWYIMHGGKVCGHTFAATINEAWQTAHSLIEDSAEDGAPPFPNWPADAGAALALLREVAQRARQTIEITLYPDGSYGAMVCETGQTGPPGDMSLTEYLSRLALEALRGGA